MKKLLGDVTFSKKSFHGLDACLKQFESKEFLSLADRKKSHIVNQALCSLIQAESDPCFLLAPTLEFIEKVSSANVLEHYVFNSFELWLNQLSGLSFEENYKVRAKIAGKYLDRGEYTALFPIGLGKVFEGTHFVTAHKSPDLDTTVASFWGWLDAFAARVGDGMHLWNVPGGPPSSQIEIDLIFKDLFGPAVFTHLAKKRTALHLTGKDLMDQEGMVVQSLDGHIGDVDHDRDQLASVLVDAQGFYLGDWRSSDVEGVRDVILLLSTCLRWFENQLNLRFLEVFAKKSLQLKDVAPLLAPLFEMKVAACEPARDFTKKQSKKVADFLAKVLHVDKGLESSFNELFAVIGAAQYREVSQIVASLESAQLFDAKGQLIEDRSLIFGYLEKAIAALHEAVIQIRREIETLDVALKIKNDVYGHLPTYVSIRSDLEEIKAKMGSHSYLTVNYPDKDKLYPGGVVRAADIRKSILGTVSLRDFCNRDEMTIPPYLEVISVIDHHKSTLLTSAPPFAIISDAQSCNSLVAKQAFIINDRNSLGGLATGVIDEQLAKELMGSTPAATRMTQKLLRRRQIARAQGQFFVHPEREYTEYLHFLYAILEDTDLLTKVTPTDVECVVDLLNRLKSLSSALEIEIISLDHIARDKSFSKKAAAHILQNEDLYSLYRKVYDFREKEVELNMDLASSAKDSNFFADTKEQNGCCRIGQTKMFANNVSFFEKKVSSIRSAWVNNAKSVYQDKPNIALHIHMMSTIVSAEDVYKGVIAKPTHKDELWIWIPRDDMAVERLKAFLGAFQTSPGLQNNPMELELFGDSKKELEMVFKESFLSIPVKHSKSEETLAVLRYNPGTLNSRKAMVAPFLPV